ncbi:hypothetical protein [Cellulosimicrobium arenosum]|nr:hypothetical protein [Cellulosimicrobium arenosum]
MEDTTLDAAAADDPDHSPGRTASGTAPAPAGAATPRTVRAR